MQSVEAGWRDSLFSDEPIFFDGMPQADQLRYRAFVRDNIFRTVKAHLALTTHFASSEQFNRWLSQWLRTTGPQTRLYWKLPIEFALWFTKAAGEEERVLAELAHFEAMHISSRNAQDNADNFHESAFSKQDLIELDLSCRLCIYLYPVHQLSKMANELPAFCETPNFLLIHRREEETVWLEIDPALAQFLFQLAEGKTIDEGLSSMQQLYQVIDVDALMRGLAKLNHQKILWPGLSCATQ